MVRHIVLIKFQSDLSEAAILALWDELREIRHHLPGVLAIAAGRSESPEGIERGYLHGFTVDFTDWAALAAYQAHPIHKQFGARLVARADDGIDGILVFDLAA